MMLKSFFALLVYHGNKESAKPKYIYIIIISKFAMFMIEITYMLELET